MQCAAAGHQTMAWRDILCSYTCLSIRRIYCVIGSHRMPGINPLAVPVRGGAQRSAIRLPKFRPGGAVARCTTAARPRHTSARRRPRVGIAVHRASLRALRLRRRTATAPRSNLDLLP